MQTTIDGRASWAICDKLSTVAVSRLSVDRRGIAKMPADEFDAIVRRVLEWLPTPA
jgi:mRNA interferase MazF